MTLPHFDIQARPMVEDPRKLGREKLAIMTSRIRYGITAMLVLEPASVAELAAELGVPAEKVRYHLNRLRDLGFVDLHGTTRRRGVVENLYSADPRKFVSDGDETASTPRHRFDRPYARLLRVMFQEAIEAAQSGDFDSRPEATNVRFPLPLDERGWDEAAEIFRQLVHDVFSVREAAGRRLEADGEPPIRASAVVLHFERAGEDAP
jgi:DNA-binding transcriptional ArsR family regulator